MRRTWARRSGPGTGRARAPGTPAGAAGPWCGTTTPRDARPPATSCPACARLDLGDQQSDHPRKQVPSIAHVRVEGHHPAVELGRETAHGQRLEPLRSASASAASRTALRLSRAGRPTCVSPPARGDGGRTPAFGPASPTCSSPQPLTSRADSTTLVSPFPYTVREYRTKGVPNVPPIDPARLDRRAAARAARRPRRRVRGRQEEARRPVFKNAKVYTVDADGPRRRRSRCRTADRFVGTSKQDPLHRPRHQDRQPPPQHGMPAFADSHAHVG